MDPYDYGRQSQYIPATGMRPMLSRPTQPPPPAVSTAAHGYDRSFMVAESYNHLVRVLHDMDYEGKACQQFQSILDSLMAECSRANIEAGKTWIFDHCRQPIHMEAISDYCVTLSYSKDSFYERLHLVYLMNDVLYHSERRQIEWMKDAMTPRLANLLGQAYHASGTTDDMRAKVDKVLTIWEDKRFLDAGVVNHIRKAVQFAPPPPPPPSSSSQSMHGAPNIRPTSFVGGASHPSSATGAATMGYQGYPPPPPFPGYSVPPPFYAARPMQSRPSLPTQGSPSSTPQPYPAQMAIHPPPPPQSNMAHIKPSPSSTNIRGETMPPTPTKPYHELPAGLMVDALKLDAAPYCPIDPSDIRSLSNPSATSKGLSQEVEQFYEGLDLKDSTGNFEESIESKLDRSGWEPGYLDTFYEKRDKLQHDQQNKKRRNSSEGQSRRSRDYPDRSPSRGRSHHRRRKRSYSRSPSYSSRSRSRSKSRSRSPPPSRRRPRSRSPSPYRGGSRSRFGGYGSPQQHQRPSPSSKKEDRHTASYSQTPSDPYDAYRRSNSYNYNRDHRSSGVCFNCSKPGHLARDCPEKTSRYHH